MFHSQHCPNCGRRKSVICASTLSRASVPKDKWNEEMHKPVKVTCPDCCDHPEHQQEKTQPHLNGDYYNLKVNREEQLRGLII